MNELLKSDKICLNQKNRITKAHYQSFYLLHTEYTEEEVNLKITGSTLNVYTIKISNNTFKCDCPDKFNCYSKKIYCKHICFIICLIGKIYTEDIFINKILTDEYKLILSINLRISSKNDPNIVNEMLSERFIKLSCKDMSVTKDSSNARNLEEDCQICYLEFENKDKKEIFKCPDCLNAIHKKCFDIWMKYNQNCVFCRKKITITSPKKESKYLNISRD